MAAETYLYSDVYGDVYEPNDPHPLLAPAFQEGGVPPVEEDD